MRRWIKYAIVREDTPQYLSASGWRFDHGVTDGKRVQVSDEVVSERYKLYLEYILSHTDKSASILSVGSGYAHNELLLHRSGRTVVCSDVESTLVESVRTKEPTMPYTLYDPRDRPFEKRFDATVSLGVFYLFSPVELLWVFRNMHKSLKEDGVLIIDVGGAADNTITFALDCLQKVEMLCYFIFLKLSGSNVRLVKKTNGYRSTDAEIIKAAEEVGFTLKEIDYADYLTELNKRTWLGRMLAKVRSVRRLMVRLGVLCPYVRLMVFARGK